MSILISGVQMPESCQDCPCSGDKCFREFYGKDAPDLCNLLNVDVTHYTNSRHKNCPLIEVPDTYEIKTRALTDEERKSYLEALKKDAVQTGGRLYSTDDNDFKSYISNIMNEFSKVEYKETNGLEE